MTNCLPEPDQFSSCEDLMRNRVLRWFMWILGISAFLGNGFVILWRLRPHQSQRSNPVQEILVWNLAIADGLMGVYMLIIASADMYYRDIYIAYAEIWQTSLICKLAGFLSVLSSESSVLFLTVISIDRFLCITFPFGQIKLRRKSTTITAIAVWCFVFTLSLIPITIPSYFSNAFYGRSSVCLALPLTNDRPPGWIYSTAVFLGLNLISFTVIALCYIAMYTTVRMSSKRVKSNSGVNREQIEMALRMSFLVGTDFICWMPIIIMGILSLTDSLTIPSIVYVWTAVFVLPINSSLNPYLYTILTREVARRKTKSKRYATSYSGGENQMTALTHTSGRLIFRLLFRSQSHRVLPFALGNS